MMTSGESIKLNDGSKCLIPKYVDFDIDDKGTQHLKNSRGLIVGQKPRSSLYVDQSHWPYAGMEKIPEQIDSADFGDVLWAVPSPPWHLNIFDKQQYQVFVDKIKNLYQQTDYSIMLAVGCNLFEMGSWMRGMDNFLVDIMLDKKGVGRLLDKFIEGYMALLEKVLEGVGDYVDLLQFGDDLGSQQSAFIPPKIFAEIFKPGTRRCGIMCMIEAIVKYFYTPAVQIMSCCPV
ncbi:MAG: hypothetical protein U5N58_05220 [Actinomycetota bacterium]|nr:hypothetical protein [Actinomycetota bacterium]